MTLIHRTLKFISSICLLLLMVASSFSMTADTARRNAARTQKRDRAESRRATDKKRNTRSSFRGIPSRTSSSAKRGRAAERRRLEAKRRAEAARLAAIARERAFLEAIRNKVQLMIAKDDISGEDPEIRRAAVNALGNHAGTVVVMDPHTGQVYSIVNQEWAVREGFKPCSTIKLVTALAGLNEKVIDPANTANISESNRVDLTRALAYSKNDYFQQVGDQVGLDKMISYARRLGLGEKTGINMRNEIQGRVPASRSGAGVNRIYSHGDEFKVTALQLATLVSAMANGGKLVTPFIARTPQETSGSKVRRSVNIESHTWQHMVPGMVGAVNYGSGRKAFDPRETVAGKTGTCIEQGNWVGLFTSYAPLKNPKLVVVVIARGVDGRNHFPAAVAGRIYRELNGRFGTPASLEIAGHSTAQSGRLDASNSSATLDYGQATLTSDDDKESDEADDDTAESKPSRTIWGTERTPADSKVKPVLMSIPKGNDETKKPAGASNVAPGKGPQTGERPRRVFGRQE